MRLKVLSYNKDADFHICETEDGEQIRVDIMVDGGLSCEPEQAIGKDIVCRTITQYMLIANEVSFDLTDSDKEPKNE